MFFGFYRGLLLVRKICFWFNRLDLKNGVMLVFFVVRDVVRYDYVCFDNYIVLIKYID